MAKKKLTKEVYLKWYEDMLFWRKFEDMTSALYIQQKIRGFLHLYNGQEALLAGALLAMEPGDKMITAYRNHVQPIGLGVDPRKIMAELMGKVTGTSRGKGGSMHMFSKEHHFYGGHGIVGGQIPLGAGLAFADKYEGRNNVTLTYMGDGAVRQGSLHETFNLAMLWNLPVVFVVENNGYAMGTSLKRTANHEEIWAWATKCRACPWTEWILLRCTTPCTKPWSAHVLAAVLLFWKCERTATRAIPCPMRSTTVPRMRWWNSRSKTPS